MKVFPNIGHFAFFNERPDVEFRIRNFGTGFEVRMFGLRLISLVWKTVKTQGKVMEKSGNFDIENEWQSCYSLMIQVYKIFFVRSILVDSPV